MQKIDLLAYVEEQIEVFVRNHKHNHPDTSPDFRVKVVITRDFEEKDGNLVELTPFVLSNVTRKQVKKFTP